MAFFFKILAKVTIDFIFFPSPYGSGPIDKPKKQPQKIFMFMRKVILVERLLMHLYKEEIEAEKNEENCSK